MSTGRYLPEGIRVNCVSPHGVATPMVCDVLGMDAASVEARFSGMANLKGVVLKKDHVAEAVVYLASAESAYKKTTLFLNYSGISRRNLRKDHLWCAYNQSESKKILRLLTNWDPQQQNLPRGSVPRFYVPSVYIIRITCPTAQSFTSPSELQSEEQTISSRRKWELKVPFYFKPPDLLKVCNGLKST
ncbi:Short-chain dehydrogenase reductase 3b [Sesamum angolense]|uniref:Short-chain dehydrogenase reductase 3b n=1 Tax=Sesamum angolense TaxID=2727404 RepID=A0AAE1WPE1_9LAMI|nr:Short-chain dehydrogenase reductase 3b [Sesamum angolense]